MSLSESDMLSTVNSRLHRSETSITSQLKRVLRTLSAELLYKKAVTNLTVTSEDTELTAPTDLIDIVTGTFVLNDGSSDGPPLSRMSVAEYRNARQNSASNYSEPSEFAVAQRPGSQTKTILLYPASDGSYTGKYEYYAWYNYSSGDVALPDEFLDVVEAGATYETAMDYGLERYIMIWAQKYSALLKQMKGTVLLEPCITQEP